MKTGVDLRTATADLQTIAAQLAKQYPDSNAGRTERLWRCNRIWSAMKPALFVLLAAVVLVLLIACANVANLFRPCRDARARDRDSTAWGEPVFRSSGNCFSRRRFSPCLAARPDCPAWWGRSAARRRPGRSAATGGDSGQWSGGRVHFWSRLPDEFNLWLDPGIAGLATAGRASTQGSSARFNGRGAQSPVAFGLRRFPVCAFVSPACRRRATHSQLCPAARSAARV